MLRSQSFALVLDTGSSDLWFATTGCSGCSSGTPLLDPTKSSSFQSTSRTIPLSYGSGNATGTQASDTVSVGPFTVPEQTFGEQSIQPSPSCFACVGRLVSSHNARFMFLCSQRQGDLVRSPNAKAYPSQPSSWRGGYSQLWSSASTASQWSPIICIHLSARLTDLTSVAVDSLSSGLIDGKLSGIFGLGFQGIANTRAVPFWQALLANNLLTNPEFSFFITRFIDDQSAAQEEPGGVFTLGGTNSTLFQGDIDFRTFTPVGAGGSFWLQTISGALTHRRYKRYD